MLLTSDTEVDPADLSVWQLFLSNLRPCQMHSLDTLVKKYPSLLTGSFFLRPISKDGVNFNFPGDDSLGHPVLAWSRLADGQEFLCAFNRNSSQPAVVYVTVDDALHAIDGSMQCLYASDLSPAELNIETRNGKSIRLTVPPHALVIYS